MVKLDISTTTGIYDFRNTGANLTSDPDVLAALELAWSSYNRSAAIYVNDLRVFLNVSPVQGMTLATQANDSDALPWIQFIQAVEAGTLPGVPVITPGPQPGPQPQPGPTPVPLPGQAVVYRMVLETLPGRIDTGASYPGCSRSNSTACQPMQFASIQDAVEYAYAHGEIPYRVFTAEESWQTIEGILPIDTSRILAPVGPEPGNGGPFSSPATILLIGAGLLLLAGRGTK